MYGIQGGKGLNKEVTVKGRVTKKLKGVHIFYKIIKVPTYILIILCLLNSMSAIDIAGIALSLAVLGLVATLGNDLKFISNFLIN
jgi:hypothetical protein